MTKTLIYSLTLCFLFSACQSTQSNEKIEGYQIEVAAKYFADGTTFILIENNKPIDTAYVKNKQVTFRNSQLKQPKKLILHSPGALRPVPIWVEKGLTKVDINSVDFIDFSVEGGELQKLYNDLMEKQASIEPQIMELMGQLYLPNLDGHKKDSLQNAAKQLLAQKEAIEKNFIREHPNSLVSMDVLNVYKKNWGKAQVLKLFAPTNNEIKESPYAKSIAKYLEITKNTGVGEPFVDFTQKTPAGTTATFSELDGQYKLIEFWAAWCGPCRKANPELIKVFEQYKNKGFNIMGVSLDNNEKAWLEAIEKDALPWVQVSDLEGTENEVATIYGVNAIPDNVLIDPSGQIIARRLEPQQLADKLADLLK